MTREEAINKLKHLCSPEQMTALKVLVPELQESEDERIRKRMIEHFKSKTKKKEQPTNEEMLRTLRTEYEKGVADTITKYEQKEQTEELSTRLNSLMQEYVYAGKDEEEQEYRLKCYQLFWDALGDSEFFEQKEQKPVILGPDETEFPYNHPANTLEGEIKNIWSKLSRENAFVASFEGFREVILHFVNFIQKDQKPVITGDDVAWIDELKHDLEHPEELDKKVKEALKQKPVELTGELSTNDSSNPSGLVARNVTQEQVYKETLQPTEWSEEDKKELKYTVSVLERCGFSNSANWLKSLPNHFSLKRTNVTVDSKLTYDENGEPELTQFEGALFSAFSDAWQEYMRGETVNVAHWAKEHSKELLEVAKEDSAEWSEEDKEIIGNLRHILNAYAFEHSGLDVNGDYIEQKYIDADSWLKSVRPQPKQESEPIEIKYAGKIYKVYGTKELPGGVVGYIIEDEHGHYDCILNPDEVLGGGYGIKSNGSPYPTKEANFGQHHWKPSKEQMKALNEVANNGVLLDLFNDLLKLL